MIMLQYFIIKYIEFNIIVFILIDLKGDIKLNDFCISL